MNSNQIILKMTFDRWNALLKNFDTVLNGLSDEQLQKEIAPGKNRGIWLLGHLIAVHDDMLVLLDLGGKLYPAINETFKAPDMSVAEIPSVNELRAYWKNQNDIMAQKFGSLKADDWFEKHTAVSAEEFGKEPHRNKLNIIITRTSHLSYHLGQFVLLN